MHGQSQLTIFSPGYCLPVMCPRLLLLVFVCLCMCAISTRLYSGVCSEATLFLRHPLDLIHGRLRPCRPVLYPRVFLCAMSGLIRLLAGLLHHTHEGEHPTTLLAVWDPTVEACMCASLAALCWTYMWRCSDVGSLLCLKAPQMWRMFVGLHAPRFACRSRRRLRNNAWSCCKGFGVGLGSRGDAGFCTCILSAIGMPQVSGVELDVSGWL